MYQNLDNHIKWCENPIERLCNLKHGKVLNFEPAPVYISILGFGIWDLGILLMLSSFMSTCFAVRKENQIFCRCQDLSSKRMEVYEYVNMSATMSLI